MQKATGQKHLITDKPFSESCVRNQEPILAILRDVFALPGKVLEIGSGTGQHAVHFAAAMPHLHWQTSDLPENHPGILAWLNEAELSNLLPPITLDVNGDWPIQQFDGVFTANTLHIVSWNAAQNLIKGAAGLLQPGGKLAIYGPFNYGGQFTSDSNARFEDWLKARNPESGIRDFEAVAGSAKQAGLTLETDYAMPANNRLLIFNNR